MKTKSFLTTLVFATVGWLVLESTQNANNGPHRSLSLKGSQEDASSTTAHHLNDADACSSSVHGDLPILHDKTATMMQNELPSLTDSKPVLTTIRDGHYVLRQPLEEMHSRVSAWTNVDGVVVSGDGLVPPDHNAHYPKNNVLLGGDYFALADYGGQWGGLDHHFLPSALPVIAYFRSVLPKAVQFILPLSGTYHRVLSFIDPDFVKNRVIWIPGCFDCFETEILGGTLTIPINNRGLLHSNSVLYQRALRNWLKTTRPNSSPEGNRKTVIYCKRPLSMNQPMEWYEGETATMHGPAPLDREQEEELLRRVRQAMIRYNKDDLDLVVFDGTKESWQHMNRHSPGAVTLPEKERVIALTMEEKFALLRSAQTIIGPHGTVLAANLIWVDPSPKDCKSRVQMLEFTTSPAAAREQQGEEPSPHARPVVAQTRGLIIDHHVAFYLPNSTNSETFVDLDMVDAFFDDVWGSGVKQ